VTAAELITRRRKQLLVHRFCYYVRAESLIDDLTYDIWERELRQAVEENKELAATLPYADDCPLTCVGSSNLSDYPRELQHVADSLLCFVQKYGGNIPASIIGDCDEVQPLRLF